MTVERFFFLKGKSEERFELLAILDFDNVRKRMSVIARGPLPSKRIQILCKGAGTTEIINTELVQFLIKQIVPFLKD